MVNKDASRTGIFTIFDRSDCWRDKLGLSRLKRQIARKPLMHHHIILQSVEFGFGMARFIATLAYVGAQAASQRGRCLT
jgi:hypothetical protein